jgi:hypothetical protein
VTGENAKPRAENNYLHLPSLSATPRYQVETNGSFDPLEIPFIRRSSAAAVFVVRQQTKTKMEIDVSGYATQSEIERGQP